MTLREYVNGYLTLVEHDITGIKAELEQLPALREILDTDGKFRLEAGLATRREQLTHSEQTRDHFIKRLEDYDADGVDEQTILEELRERVRDYQERFK